MTCRTCGVPSSRDCCHYCTRSVELVKAGRCVYCALPFSRLDDLRTEGLCHECRTRHVVVSAGTRNVLKLAARARWRAAPSGILPVSRQAAPHHMTRPGSRLPRSMPGRVTLA